MRVKWLRIALQDLTSIHEFIARDNREAASRSIEQIEAAVEMLTQFPAMGKPGRVPGTRELVVPHTQYVVPYRVREDRIEILAVIHAARKWPENF